MRKGLVACVVLVLLVSTNASVLLDQPSTNAQEKPAEGVVKQKVGQYLNTASQLLQSYSGDPSKVVQPVPAAKVVPDAISKPSLTSMWDIKGLVDSLHMEPKLGYDGKLHHFYKDETQDAEHHNTHVQFDVPLVQRPPPGVVSHFMNFHPVRRVGVDGRPHFFYVDPADKSDHTGQHVADGSDTAKLQVPAVAPALAPMASLERQDTQQPQQQPDLVVPESPQNVPAAELASAPLTAFAFRSDVSGAVLQVGKFYHKIGEAIDISDEEWNQLPLDEKAKYILIHDLDDVHKYMPDFVSAQQPRVQSALQAPSPSTPEQQQQQQQQPNSVHVPQLAPLDPAKVAEARKRIAAKAQSSTAQPAAKPAQAKPALKVAPPPARVNTKANPAVPAKAIAPAKPPTPLLDI